MEKTSDMKPGEQGAAARAHHNFRRMIDAADILLVGIAAASLFVLMLVVVADVSLRYLVNSPLQWSFDVISNYLMPGLFFLAVSHTLKVHAHVSVDLVHNYVAERTRYAFEFACSALAVPVFALCAWFAARITYSDFQSGITASSGLPIPTWSVSFMLPLGFGLLTLRMLLNTLGYLISIASGSRVLPLPPISGTEGSVE